MCCRPTGKGLPERSLRQWQWEGPVVTTDVPGCRETVVDGCQRFPCTGQGQQGACRGYGKISGKFLALLKEWEEESRRIAVEKYDVKKVNGVLLSEMDVS